MDLLLAEKPSSAKAIARALGNSQRKLFNRKTSYYIVDNDKYVASACGHLFTLYPKITERGIFPKFDFEWTSVWTNNNKLYYAKNYFECLKYITSQYNFDKYIIATDFDIEGTVIGFMTLTSLKIPMEKVYRMKMNSLAKSEVLKAYQNLESPDYSWFKAGITRHETDILYGINLTEAFSTAVTKVRNRRRTVSLGRVQTPTLKFVVDKEREIENFISTPFWNVLLNFEYGGQVFIAKHICEDIFDNNEVARILEVCKTATTAKVEQIKKEIKETDAPALFNLPMLQQEAFYKLGFNPDFCDRIAQSLYQQALMSYPRTGSTAIWTGVPYKKVLDALEKETAYSAYIQEIKEKNYEPHKRGITDMSHSAIYPTGEPYTPKTSYEAKLLDMIKRRFIAVFYPNLRREHSELILNVNGEHFRLEGQKTIDYGWLNPYTYRKVEDHILPELQIGIVLPVKSILSEQKQTLPPHRYSSASLVKKMESENIGTKATRAEIVKTLWKRGYVAYEKNVGLKPTLLGTTLIDVAEKFCPVIIDVNLTRNLEQDLENIIDDKIKRETVICNVKNNITEILNLVNKNFQALGEQINTALMKEP